MKQPDIGEKIRLSLYPQNFKPIALSENSSQGTGQRDKCAREVYKEKRIFYDMMKKLVARTYKFRIFPSRSVARKLEKTVGACRFLYNSELEYEEQLFFSEGRFVSRD
ncbi:MAG: helix-turn-helix domain-containing protein, partial [Chloroflexota bacterium]|nr:helix-turn-helix domain-containing protein [Chloroflexota bacterium]